MEKDAKVSVRSKDVQLAEAATKEAAAKFKSEAGYEVKLTVDGDLPAES